MLTLAELRQEVDAGRVHEVIVGVPDLQGRIQGSRVGARHFLEQVVERGIAGCLYLLASDVEMNTGPGYAVDAWQRGFGDFRLQPDLTTLRALPWDPGTALVIGDALDDDRPVEVAPRQVLRAQLDRLADRGLTALVGTELEFLVFLESYRSAWDSGYRGLRPASRYNTDFALQGLAEIEPVVRRIRREMGGAGLTLETARAECHPGQYEIVFRYAEAMTTCDNHVVFKAGAKQIAADEGVALTFMPKFDDDEGNSCHVHLSLRGVDGALAFADDDGGMSTTMDHFVAGLLAGMAELTLLMAPNVNSYKRLQPGCFAPTGIAWGHDNRTCSVRVVGRGDSLRVEHRVPGGDANPYLAVAAVLAAGLRGIELRLPVPEPYVGNAFADHSVPALPRTLGEAVRRWEESELARDAFGATVVGHYATAARAELAAYESSVTDWERVRGFERM